MALALSAFQGRLINFEKRRKVSSPAPHGTASPTPPHRAEHSGVHPPACYVYGEHQIWRWGDLSQWQVETGGQD